MEIERKREAKGEGGEAIQREIKREAEIFWKTLKKEGLPIISPSPGGDLWSLDEAGGSCEAWE